jgi:NADPH:quinone reductase-like Zn-dependent oxidoreductase
MIDAFGVIAHVALTPLIAIQLMGVSYKLKLMKLRKTVEPATLVPEIGDDDVLVRVEGCGVCGTDAHEYKRDPFGLIPVVLGHEGTGEIVKIGKNVKKDSAGKPLGVGDKVASCVALFGFGNLEAFPIDVWIKRAIDLHFDGSLDPKSLGSYAGVAQKYIFHYLRNLDTEK